MEVTPIREADASPITPSKPIHVLGASSSLTPFRSFMCLFLNLFFKLLLVLLVVHIVSYQSRVWFLLCFFFRCLVLVLLSKLCFFCHSVLFYLLWVGCL